MRALSARPFCPCDDRWVSLRYLSAGLRYTTVQVDDRGIVTVSLAPGVFINPDGAAQLAGTSAPTSLKGPAKHRAFGETIAPGQFAARTTPKELRADLVVEALGPLHSCAEGL